MNDAVAIAHAGGNAHGKAIPRGKADIGLNGQIDADGENKQPEGGFQYFFYHLHFCLHHISPVNARAACLFFCGKRKTFVCFCRSIYFNTSQTAFQYQLPQKRMIHEGAFQ